MYFERSGQSHNKAGLLLLIDIFEPILYILVRYLQNRDPGAFRSQDPANCRWWNVAVDEHTWFSQENLNESHTIKHRPSTE